MINRIQFKTSILIGTAIMILQFIIGVFPHTGLHKTFSAVLALCPTSLWYVPILYFILRFFVICGVIYLIFRVINYVLNFVHE